MEDVNIAISQKEAVCLARHLMILQRQTAFNEISNIGEACGGCEQYEECSKAQKFISDDIYKRITQKAGIRVSFRMNEFPLVPHCI